MEKRDITARERAEEAIRKSEEYRWLFENMNEGIAVNEIIYDARGKPVDYVIKDINPSFESILDIKREQAIGQRATVLYDTKEAPYIDIYSQVAETGTPTRFETYFAPTKKYFNIAVFSPAKGQFATVFTDITHHIRTEEALKASEKNLRAITSSLGEGVYMIDKNGRLTFMNPEAERLLGWTEAELLGKDMHDVTHYRRADGTPMLARECPILKVTKVGTTYRIEDDIFIRKDGSMLPVAYVTAPILEDKKVVASITAFQDITERKQTEEELRKSKASLADAQHIAHIGSWDWNVLTNELRWSDEIYRIFGLTPQEFGATYEAFLNSVHLDNREFVKKSVDAAIYESKPYSIDHRIVLPDGSERIVHDEAQVILSKDGKAIRMIGTIQDITERKRAEEILEKRQQLAKQVYADAMAAVTGGQFMLCDYENVKQQRRGLPVLSRFVARPEEVHPVHAFLDSFLARRGVDPRRRFEVQLAAIEALTNSVKHAGGGKIEIRSDEVLQVEVADSGHGINFSMLPRSVLMLGFSTKGTLGFGFNIMLEFADHLYLATGPSGTTVVLEFQWS